MIVSEHYPTVDMALSPAPPAEIRSLLSSYLLNLKRGQEAVRQMIVRDLCLSLELGATKQAADLRVVLQRFASMHPVA